MMDLRTVSGGSMMEMRQGEPVKEKPKYDITGFGYALSNTMASFGLTD